MVIVVTAEFDDSQSLVLRQRCGLPAVRLTYILKGSCLQLSFVHQKEALDVYIAYQMSLHFFFTLK